MTQPAAPGTVAVQVVVPARNEEASLGCCLASLTSQKGIDFRITVVDDGSTDRTLAIAQSFAGVRVISATEPSPHVSGKCNALIQGAANAMARWLLFTDADTYHYPGSLQASVSEAEARGVDFFSLSPEQEVISWGEQALLPVIFGELARTYSPQRVNDPADPAVAANGQYLLARREVYERLGGHQAVSDKILEDVELARIFKASHHKIWFRHGAGRVRTRMYRDFRSMTEGWTKNLVLLFPHPLRLAFARSMEFLSILVLPPSAVVFLWRSQYAAGSIAATLGLLVAAAFFRRVLRAHFPARANLKAFFGLPVFVGLLMRSWLHSSVRGTVTWKGRTYSNRVAARTSGSSIAEEAKISRGRVELRNGLSDEKG
jgi:glycosyltransferase involved in cell wall biosynthesis